MSGYKFSRLVLFGGVFAALFAFLPNQGSLAADASPWLSDDPSLDKIKDLATGELPPYSINGNRDCQTQKVITRPGRLLPTPQTEQSHQSCVVDTGYGAYSQSGYLQRQGTTIAGPVNKFTGGTASIIPIPHSNTLLQIGGVNAYNAYLNFTGNAADALGSAQAGDGQVTHKINVPPTVSLKDVSGQLLPTRTDTLSFSANGLWMVVDVPFIGTIRVNTETFAVLPFGDSLNYNIGLDPGLQTAITSDGRYAAVASRSFTIFRLYDLSTCAPVPAHITGKVACSSVDLWPFMLQQVPGFTGVGRLRFRSDYTLEFYTTYTVGGVNKTAQHVLTAAGQAASGYGYLALGDSYTSGEGAYEYKALTDTDNNKCHLSQRSYPYLLGHDLGLNQYESVACSGAIIDDIISESRDYEGQVRDGIQRKDRNADPILDNFNPGYLAQREFVSEHKPNIITVSAVGNDIGFASKLFRCMEPDTCYSTYEDRLEVVREVNAQFYKLTNMYTQLQSNNPRAKIYAIGYPQVAKPGGNCALNVHLNQQELEFTEGLINHLNNVIKSAAEKVGVQYVDIEDSLFGSRLCETDSWNVAVNGATLGNDKFINFGPLKGPIGNESFHPNALGHRQIAQKIAQQTSGFTQPMPTPNPNASLPSEDGLAILNASKSGRALKTINFDGDTSNNVVYRQQPWAIYVDAEKLALKVLSPFKVLLHSDPIDLGTYSTDAVGNLSIQTTIPDTAPTGFHALHLQGQNAAGEEVDIYKMIFVAANEEDLDGDGLPNATDPCFAVEPSGTDSDQDGTDDACDGFIDQPPLDIGSSFEKTQITYSDPEGSFAGVSVNTASQSSGQTQTQSAVSVSQIQPAETIESPTAQPQVAAAQSEQAAHEDSSIDNLPTSPNKASMSWLFVVATILPAVAILVYIFIHNTRN